MGFFFRNVLFKVKKYDTIYIVRIADYINKEIIIINNCILQKKMIYFNSRKVGYYEEKE